MEIIMENQDEVLYRKAQKRVKEIKNFYYFVGGYIVIAAVLLYKIYAGNVFNFSKDYILIMLGLQAIFLIIYGLYLFIPALHEWEQRMLNKILQKEKAKQKNMHN